MRPAGGKLHWLGRGDGPPSESARGKGSIDGVTS